MKLVKLIASSFLPRATGAAATRLKIFLEEADKSGFADPPGMLQVGFWESKVRDLSVGKATNHFDKRICTRVKWLAIKNDKSIHSILSIHMNAHTHTLPNRDLIE